MFATIVQRFIFLGSLSTELLNQFLVPPIYVRRKSQR